MVISKVRGGAGDLINAKPADYKDNLYLAVNGAWQEKAVIPSDQSSAGGFMDLYLDIEKTLMKDFAEFAEEPDKVTDPLLKEAVKLYQLADDTDKLKELGYQPLLDDLQAVKGLTSLKDLGQNFAELAKENYVLPVNFQVDADMKDTAHNVLYLYGPQLIVPDKSYYDDGNPAGKQLLDVYGQVATKLLEMIGYSADRAKETVAAAMDFDKSLAPAVKSGEEWADYTAMYNPVEFKDFAAKFANFDFKEIVADLVSDTPEKVIVAEPRYFEQLNELVTADNFADLKAWMLVRYLTKNAGYLDEDFRQAAGKFQLAQTGAKELSTRVKYAYHLASEKFSEVVGVYYGKKYFGEKAKADVREMVEQMISVYEERITNNDWLGADTKAKAVVKLNKLVLKIGYPDKVDAVYSQFKIDENKSLYENVMAINKLITVDAIDQYTKPVDRTKWLMPGHMVNACYDPSRNDITFPAAILQAPFYSLEQTSSQNFGGIGAVIAHEISHAFDNNGAKFDEYGNMHDWWTKEDYATFKKLTQKMIDEFDGIEFAGGKVNGTLVVSENIADVGGLRCALEAAKKASDYDVKEFFTNWSRVWRTKATQQRIDKLLVMDPHSPDALRANVQAQNMDEFYDAFDVKSGDGMWLEKDKRVNIW